MGVPTKYEVHLSTSCWGDPTGINPHTASSFRAPLSRVLPTAATVCAQRLLGLLSLSLWPVVHKVPPVAAEGRLVEHPPRRVGPGRFGVVERADAVAARAPIVGGGAPTLADVRAAVVVGARAGPLGPAPRGEVAAARAVAGRPVAATGDAATSERARQPTVPVAPPVVLPGVGACSGAVVSAKSCKSMAGGAEGVCAGEGVAAPYPCPGEVGEVRRLRPVGVVAAPSRVA